MNLPRTSSLAHGWSFTRCLPLCWSLLRPRSVLRHRPPPVPPPAADDNLNALGVHVTRELAMSVITLGELRFGAEKSQSRERSRAGVARLE